MSQNQKIKSITFNGVKVPLDLLNMHSIELAIKLSNENNINTTFEVEYEKPKSNVLYAVVKLREKQEYYFINSGGLIENCWWTNDEADIKRFNINNVFLTEKNAQKQADRNQLLAEIERFANSNNEPQIDARSMWSFALAKEDMDIYLQYTFYFTNEEIKTQALTKFKDRLDILLD